MGQTLAGRGGLVRPPPIRLLRPPSGNRQDWTDHPTSRYERAFSPPVPELLEVVSSYDEVARFVGRSDFLKCAQARLDRGTAAKDVWHSRGAAA